MESDHFTGKAGKSKMASYFAMIRSLSDKKH